MRHEDGRRVAQPCENITVTNCTMRDGHGGVVEDIRVSNIVMRRIMRAPHEDSAIVECKDVSGAYVFGCRATPGTEVFLQLHGRSSRDIVLQANEFSKAAVAFKMAEDIPAGALVQR